MWALTPSTWIASSSRASARPQIAHTRGAVADGCASSVWAFVLLDMGRAIAEASSGRRRHQGLPRAGEAILLAPAVARLVDDRPVGVGDGVRIERRAGG